MVGYMYVQYLYRWSDYSYPLIRDAEPGKTRLEMLSEFLSDEALKITTTANSMCMRSEKYKNSDHSQACVTPRVGGAGASLAPAASRGRI
ncbi:hypothetical protein JYU34_015178 [Plutella xylostella]|uniref:Uncharacterized protein n=1 Tax=Plutella xylostella TaxID=51655 RepID=A0ABQ7Q6H5_PLUXY|nr:hypothetical protein JYU34_015178 [Plutella xylostella]